MDTGIIFIIILGVIMYLMFKSKTIVITTSEELNNLYFKMFYKSEGAPQVFNTDNFYLENITVI